MPLTNRQNPLFLKASNLVKNTANNVTQSTLTGLQKNTSNIINNAVTNKINGVKNKLSSGINSIGNTINNAVSGFLGGLGLGGGDGSIMDILTSTGVKSEHGEFKYVIAIQLNGNDQNSYDDTSLFVTIRAGFLKYASLHYLVTNINTPAYQAIQNDINDGKYPEGTLYIYSMSNVEKEKKKNLIYKKKMLIRYIVNKTSADIKHVTTVKVGMLLIHKVLFEMDRKYSFNQTFNTKTPVDVLKAYEGFIDSSYGTNSFISKHIISNENKYKYEQILTKPSPQKITLPDNKSYKILTKTDISVPLFLQYKYKISNSFGFYFFDDFNMREKKDIVRYFISFFDKEKFEKFDVSKYEDIQGQSKLKKTYNFEDYNKVVTKENPVMNYKTKEAAYETKKQQTGKNNTSKTQGNSKILLDPKDKSRYLYGVQSNNQTKTQKQSNEEITVQTPDDKGNAQQRINISKTTIQQKVDDIESYVNYNCSPEWLQFGMIYNLSPVISEKYLYTPIAIINVFHRLNPKEHQTTHSLEFLMLKFKEKESK